MIDAYVEGRPMSRSSSSLTSVASVYRAGGLVEWPSAATAVARQYLALAQRRQPPLSVVQLCFWVVGALDVGLHEAEERDRLARGTELDRFA